MCGGVVPLEDFSIFFQYTMRGNSDFVSPKKSVEYSGRWSNVVEFLESMINFFSRTCSEEVAAVV